MEVSKQQLKELFLKNKLNKLTKDDKNLLNAYKKFIPQLKYKRDMNKILDIINSIPTANIQKLQRKISCCYLWGPAYDYDNDPDRITVYP